MTSEQLLNEAKNQLLKAETSLQSAQRYIADIKEKPSPASEFALKTTADAVLMHIHGYFAYMSLYNRQ